jgi:hypothetical protein
MSAGSLFTSAAKLAGAVAVRKIATGGTVAGAVKGELMTRALLGMGQLGKSVAENFRNRSGPDHEQKPEEVRVEPGKIKAQTIKSKDDSGAVQEHTTQLVTGLTQVQKTATQGFTRASGAANEAGNKISRGVDKIAEAIARQSPTSKKSEHWLDQPRDEQGRFQKKKPETPLAARPVATKPQARLKPGTKGRLSNFANKASRFASKGLLGIGAGVTAYDEYQKSGSVAKAGVRAGGFVGGSVGGAIAGQMLIPIPIVGALIGGAVGGYVGDKAADAAYDWVASLFGKNLQETTGSKGEANFLVAQEMKFDVERKIRFEVDETVTFKEAGCATGEGGGSAPDATQDENAPSGPPGATPPTGIPTPKETPAQKKERETHEAIDNLSGAPASEGKAGELNKSVDEMFGTPRKSSLEVPARDNTRSAASAPAPATPDAVISAAASGKISPNSSVVEEAMKMKGLHAGRDRSALASYLKAGGKGNGGPDQAWCASFVNASLAKAGIKGSDSAAAGSFHKWGSKVDKPEDVKAGDVVVNYTRSPRTGMIGSHVEIATGPAERSANGSWVIPTIGGNVSNSVKEGRQPFDKWAVRRAGEYSGADARVAQENKTQGRAKSDEYDVGRPPSPVPPAKDQLNPYAGAQAHSMLNPFGQNRMPPMAPNLPTTGSHLRSQAEELEQTKKAIDEQEPTQPSAKKVTNKDVTGTESGEGNADKEQKAQPTFSDLTGTSHND